MRQFGKLVEVVRHTNEILGDGYRLSIVSADHLAVQGRLTDVLRQLAVGFSRLLMPCWICKEHLNSGAKIRQFSKYPMDYKEILTKKEILWQDK